MTLHFVRGLSKTRCLQTRNRGWENKSKRIQRQEKRDVLLSSPLGLLQGVSSPNPRRSSSCEHSQYLRWYSFLKRKISQLFRSFVVKCLSVCFAPVSVRWQDSPSGPPILEISEVVSCYHMYVNQKPQVHGFCRLQITISFPIYLENAHTD